MGGNLLFTPDPLFLLLDPQSSSWVLFFVLFFGLFCIFLFIICLNPAHAHSYF